MRSDPTHDAAVRAPVAVPIDASEATRALGDGPTGALIIASIAVGLLLIGWLAFYFLLFMPRGSIG
jgi:hypothetical protein